jgi:PAS domain S-box-containing protein
MSSPHLSLDLPSLEQMIDRSPMTVSTDVLIGEVITLMGQSQGNHCRLLDPDAYHHSDLLSTKHSSCVLVMAGTELVGILTERDIVRLVASGVELSGVKVAEVMTCHVITLTLSEAQTALTASTLLRQHRVRHLPILDAQGQLLGLVTPSRIRQALQPMYLLRLYRVAEIMTTAVIYAPRSVSVLEIAQLMAESRVSCVVIAETDSEQANRANGDGCLKPLGIITERDIVQFRALALNFGQIQAETVMSAPLFCLHPSDSLWVAQQRMQAQYVQRLVVSGDRGELLGIVTQTNLLQVLDPLEIATIVETLHHQIDAQTLELQRAKQQLQQRVTDRTEELVQTDLRLRESEIRLQRLAETVVAMLYQYVLRADGSEAFTYVSPRCSKIYELEPEELLRDFGLIWAMIHPEDIQRVHQANRHSAEQLQCFDVEFRLLPASGCLRWVRAISQPELQENGDIIWDGLVLDITEKKQLEAQFLRAQRLESIGTLSSGIAHDLNNILAPILMGAQLLQQQFPEGRQQELLKILEVNARRGSDLVQQVLTFAKGTEGQRLPLQLKHLLYEVQQICEHTFPKSITIRLELPSTLAVVSADSTQLHQVLMNLCVNARDAMPNGGILTMSAADFWVDETYARLHLEASVGAYVVVTVEDTGVGMTPEVIERIFDPFFTTKSVEQGTGLGLSVVQGIIRSHDGFITVESKLGQGSQFQLFLPAIADAVKSTISDSNVSTGQSELILVVDDEANILEVTKTVLEGNNYRVLTANSGLEAIACLAQHQDQIAAVLMDMMMPELSGQAVIQALRKINPNLAIIASSGLPLNPPATAADSPDIQASLPKPYTAQNLLTVLAQVLRKQHS